MFIWTSLNVTGHLFTSKQLHLWFWFRQRPVSAELLPFASVRYSLKSEDICVTNYFLKVFEVISFNWTTLLSACGDVHMESQNSKCLWFTKYKLKVSANMGLKYPKSILHWVLTMYWNVYQLVICVYLGLFCILLSQHIPVHHMRTKRFVAKNRSAWHLKNVLVPNIHFNT